MPRMPNWGKIIRDTPKTRLKFLIGQYRRSFVLLSVSLWNDLANPVFDGVGLAGFKSRASAFLLANAALFLL